MTKLGVNIDHSATLRQARYKLSDASNVIVEPDVLQAALCAELGGADSITAHLREDRRHIQDEDILNLRRHIRTKLNMEMACAKDIIKFACQTRPDYVCLVPENRLEITTEGGLDLIKNAEKAQYAIEQLSNAGAIVSIFIDPDVGQIELAKKIGATTVELHTGAYANAWKNTAKCEEQLERIKRAANRAAELGLTVNSGHGINYENVTKLLEVFPFNELNIGHTILSRSIFVGIEQATREMKKLIK